MVACTCRAALPALFRQKDAFKLLQPESFLDSDDSAADQGQEEDLPPQVPRLRENLEAFLADKLQLVDRCAGAAGSEFVLGFSVWGFELGLQRADRQMCLPRRAR